jgi:alpha-glucosidase
VPWLPPVDPGERSVSAQLAEPGSLLHLYREMIALRPSLGPGLEMLDAADGVVAYRRGDHVVAVNTTGRERPAPGGGRLAPHEAFVRLLD